MSIYPNERECIRLLENAGCSRRVMHHSCTVRAVAAAISERIPCNRDLVLAGAMLHDIGRSVDHSIMHAYEGYRILISLGLPEDLAETARKHTGAGLDQTDVEEFGLPPGDYIPATIEEKIVAHSDNLVSDTVLVKHTHSSEKLAARGYMRGSVRMEVLHRELSAEYGEDLDVLVDRLGTKPVLSGACAELR